MAYKVFSNGDALTGGELNTYLMNQAVISFATTTARDAALPSPSEGQLVWLEDSNKYVYYTGSAWSDLITPASSGNAIINGAFDIWQRGTSFSALSSTTAYTADRWYAYLGATSINVSRQSVGDTTNLPNIQYCMRVGRTAGQTSTNVGFIYMAMESANSISMAGKQVTLSYYARKGADYSTTSSNLAVGVQSGTGTDQPAHSYTGFNAVISGASNPAVLTTTWQRFTFTGTVPATATELAIGITLGFSGTAGANDYFEITGVQLESGSSATAFKRNASNIQGELAACQRYYQKTALGTSSPMGTGSYYSSTQFILHQPLKVSMRVAPTVTYNNSGAIFTVYSNGAARSASIMSLDNVSTEICSTVLTTAAATAGYAGSVNATSTSASIEFSAEL